ncbi:hypothetical protein Tco_0228378 [Tanacetum coccineum]
MEGKKLKYLKNKSFDYIQKMLDRAFNRVNIFVDFRTDLVEDEEEVTIDAIPLDVKSPRIVDWKIHKEGKKSYYQIIRVNGKSQMYMIFSHMLKSFDREDLETLYKLVKAKYKSTRPVEDLDLDTTCADLHAGRKEISPYTIYNYKYAEQEASGRIIGIKSLLNAASITAAHIRVNAAQLS